MSNDGDTGVVTTPTSTPTSTSTPTPTPSSPDDRARSETVGAAPDGSPRIGLVLGGGGAAGIAYHVGALYALEHDFGWDPRSAELIVGTSAGSIVATLLRSGASTDDLAAWCAEIAPLPGRERLRRTLEAARDEAMPIRLPSWSSFVPDPRAWWNVLTGRVGLTRAIATQWPFGFVDATAALGRFGDLLDEWPTRSLWITSVRVRDACRSVFGADGPTAPTAPGPARAVAASCAIPGLYRRVEIDGEHYIDGGAHSATNLDLLVDQRAPELDLGIVISPMSAAADGGSLRPDRLLRRHFAGQLDAEIEHCADRGLPVHRIEPTDELVDVMGVRLLDRDRGPRVLARTLLTATESIDPSLTESLRRAAAAA